MKTSFFVKVALLVGLIMGCGESVNPKYSTFDIYLDFWNTTGRTPEIRFDELNTSKEVKIDFTKTFDGSAEGNLLTKVVIDDFKILDNRSNNYDIKEIIAYEFNTVSKSWQEDVEFKVNYNQTQDVGDVVMVLDRSESLGSDFDKVKQYAINFIEQTFNTHPDVKIGIVDFSTEVNSFPLSNNKEALKAYIAELKAGPYTALYEAIDTGVEMLLRSASQSRVLVTFTDGKDNMSNQNFYNINTILAKISGDKKSAKIRSFFIGLEGKGGIDTGVVRLLTSSGWTVSMPQNTNELKDVFEKFGRLISNVYHLTYVRNQQVVNRNTPIKLKFQIKATK